MRNNDSMEAIGDILVRFFDDYEKKMINNDEDNQGINDFKTELNDIVLLDRNIKDNINIVNDLGKANQAIQNNILSYLSKLLLEYGEFKKVPQYYKNINGKAQEYVFFELDGESIKGFKVTDRNVYKDNRFIAEELYIIEDGSFYKFQFETNEKEYYKECLRTFEYCVEDPSSEWGFLNILQRIRTILAIRLEQIKKQSSREVQLVELLESFEDKLRKIIDIK